MKNKKAKENIAVNAVMRHISKTLGFNDVKFHMQEPDVKERNRPACDFITEIGCRKIAIEHTTVDSIPNQRRDNSYFERLMVPLEKELLNDLPSPGRYDINIYTGKIPKGKQYNWDDIRKRIKEWCIKVAPNLKAAPGNCGATGHYVQEQPEGVPFEVGLCKWEAIEPKLPNGNVLVGRFIPEDIEKLRLEAMQASLQTRAAKLEQYHHKGYRTILVFEDWDISLSSIGSIGDSFVSTMKKSTDLYIPDEVYVYVSIAKIVCCLKFDNSLSPNAKISPQPYECVNK